MPTTGKLLAVLAVALPVVLAGGYAYKQAQGCTWSEVGARAGRRGRRVWVAGRQGQVQGRAARQLQ
jgi:hypothetical protein